MRISDWSSDVCSSDLLIWGQNGIGRDINYLVDIPLDSRGRTPKLKKQHVLLFARRAGNAPGAIQLVALDAQINWSDQNAAMLRRLLTEAVAADPPQRLTGLENAFPRSYARVVVQEVDNTIHTRWLTYQ